MASKIKSLFESVRPAQQQQYGPVADEEDQQQQREKHIGNLPTPQQSRAAIEAQSRSRNVLLGIIAVLLLGWVTTLVCWYRAASAANMSNGPLHVYQHTPIPKEVFKPVKKTFDLDERYVGFTPEVNANWDALVAGESTVQHLQPHGGPSHD